MAAKDSPKINTPMNLRPRMVPQADLLSQMPKSEAPAAAAEPSKPVSVNRPATGYEQWRAEQVGMGGGTTIDGRRSRPKEKINSGAYKGKTPGQREVLMQGDYARLSDQDKAAATARARGEGIRTPGEMAALRQYDEGMARLRFGDQSGTGSGMPGMSGGEGGMGAPGGGAGSAGSQAAAPSEPKRVGYDGTANTPMITGEQFRQAKATGKSERVPFKPGGATPGMTVVDTAGGGRTVAGAYGTGSSRPAQPGDTGGRIGGIPSHLALQGETRQSIAAAGGESKFLPRDAKGYDGKPLRADGSAQTPTINAPRQSMIATVTKKKPSQS